ncbi:helix-turn-helix transcriptional regulator [Maricaulis parjimensis]|uniref:helix-turn-helix transcriptional regulator n=1 Tax=Maricaulis parjimensis TaxID=144023 RepID=UPI00193A969F|nr:helix-turn-helix transcriptional regulator [Maricaulis parjimensis]
MNQVFAPTETSVIHWPSVIRHYRHSKSLKQAAMAHDLGVTQTMISRWESGAAAPSARIQERIFDLYWQAHASVTRSVWLERIGQHPSVVAVINGAGRILRASQGLQRALACRRHDVEGRYLHEAFSGDLVDLFDTLEASGFFEGRVASAESMDRLDFLAPDGSRKTVMTHGLHRPSFLSGPQIVWLFSGAAVSRSVFRDVRTRLGGPRVIRKAI